MENAWVLSAVWVGLALIATLLAIWFRISTALSEIVIGTVAQLAIGAFLGTGGLLASTQWVTYPVSYTHLDVYKRQSKTSKAPTPNGRANTTRNDPRNEDVYVGTRPRYKR